MAASGGIDARRPRDAQPLRLSARRHQVPRQAEYSRARSTRFQPREKKRIVVLTCRVRSSSAFLFTSEESNSWIVDREMFWDQSRTGFDFFV